MSHLSTLNPLSLDPSRPTLFELISAEQLSVLLSPSVRYVIAYFAARYPRYLLKLILNYDELYALLAGAIELRCLRTWNSSLTESFYDLARRRVLKADRAVVSASGNIRAVQDRVDKLARLRNTEIYASLFSLVGVPYLQEKIERYYESQQSQSLFRTQASQRTVALSRIAGIRLLLGNVLLRMYPTFKLSTGAITLLLNLLYLFGKTPYHSFTDFLLGIRYSRQSGPAFTASTTGSGSSLSQRRRTAMQRLTGGALKSVDIALSGILPTAVFALKFLEWWHASDFPRQLSQSTRRQQRETQQAEMQEQALEHGELETEEPQSKYALDPPLKPHALQDKEQDKAACDICGHDMEDPTAIETGKVFCYKCIYAFIRDTAPEAKAVRCPSTGQRLLACRYDEIAGHWVASGLRRLVL
ncbi:Pex12 amino terminal region-domain-containing protein [Lipomyces arxii]|uniref:Pex12 amino terminal region-domain-containing protein n=1 Tax=Lipomyces arxii TaxID=56418 RepID=UPI0034CF81E9